MKTKAKAPVKVPVAAKPTVSKKEDSSSDDSDSSYNEEDHKISPVAAKKQESSSEDSDSSEEEEEEKPKPKQTVNNVTKPAPKKIEAESSSGIAEDILNTLNLIILLTR